MLFARRRNDHTRLVIETLSSHIDMTAGEISSATGVPVGSLQPFLFDLERQGRIVSRWESPTPRPEGPPKRRFYALPVASVRL